MPCTTTTHTSNHLPTNSILPSIKQPPQASISWMQLPPPLPLHSRYLQQLTTAFTPSAPSFPMPHPYVTLFKTSSIRIIQTSAQTRSTTNDLSPSAGPYTTKTQTDNTHSMNMTTSLTIISPHHYACLHTSIKTCMKKPSILPLTILHHNTITCHHT